MLKRFDHLKDAKKNALDLLDTSKVTEETSLNEIFGWSDLAESKDQPVYVTDKLWDDSGLELFVRSQTTLKGAGHFIWKEMKNLQTDVAILKQRQSPMLPDSVNDTLQHLANKEKDLLWLFTVPEMSKAWPINMLFPSAPVLRLLNNFPYLLEAFHLYRCYIAPCMNIITPITTIFGPWMYVRRTLNVMVSFAAYCKLLFKALKAGFQVTGNLRNDLSRVVSILVYVTLMIYTTVQSFETAAMLRKIRRDLRRKMESVRVFVAEATKIVSMTSPDLFAAWDMDKVAILADPISLSKHLSGLYRLLTDGALQCRLKMLIKAVYVLDIAAWTKRLVDTRQCTRATYGDSTVIWDMGHILLGPHQIRNPLAMKQNLIITGPNAAGKTTYVKSLFTNLILAQSLGLVVGSKATIQPVHAIGTFIRVTDTLGKASLFEAEAQRCADIIRKAQQISAQGQAGVFFLDEPMHSTPPVEGMSTCKAVLEHLACLPGIKTVTTTHYFKVTELEHEHPDKFLNLSMTAIHLAQAQAAKKTATFFFPFKIQRGPSSQCIALELLQDHQLPEDVVGRAIELKNKICTVDVNGANCY